MRISACTGGFKFKVNNYKKVIVNTDTSCD